MDDPNYPYVSEGTLTERKRKRQALEEVEMNEALLAWLTKQGREESRRLYAAGCAYFGIRPEISD